MGCKIIAIECYFPETELTNDDLRKEFPEYDFEMFEKKVGIEKRFIADEETTALDLAYKACLLLLDDGKINKEEIDFILYCTQSPDYILPTSACILQNRLGLKTTSGALDFNLGCSGYTYGLSLAKALINSYQTKNVLLVTSETYSKFIHNRDRSNRSIFGDAATATLISYTKEENIENFLFGTDGGGYEHLIIRNGAGKHRFEEKCVIKNYGTENSYTDNNLYMNGPEIFNFTSTKIPKFTEEVLEKNNLKKDEIDQYVFHQANAFMLNFVRKKMKIEKSKFYIDLKNGGNTVSNTIPIALKRYAQGIKGSENLLLVGFGVGLSWCGGIIKLDKKI